MYKVLDASSNTIWDELKKQGNIPFEIFKETSIDLLETLY